MSRAGFVLVGGRSSRMGRDKALLPFRGGFLGSSVAKAVEAVCGSVMLIGNPDVETVLGYPAIPDLYPGEGPLGGILTVLRHTAAEWNLVVACDMPDVPADFLSTLLDAAERSRHDAIIPVPPSGLPEPLCAAYHRRCLRPLEEAFAQGARKITHALKGIPVTWFKTPEQQYFQNVNTPEEWAPYARR